MHKTISLLLAGLLLTVSSAAQKMSPAHSELVETENQFARFAVEHGQPEAWIEFFTDDGVIFQPGPVNSKETMRKFLPTPNPAPNVINWEPRYGDISQAGDMGYNVGPWVITDHSLEKNPPAYGYFFSIWKKQADAKWKVVVDFGIRVPSATPDHTLGKSFKPVGHYVAKIPRSINLTEERQALIRLDQGFTAAAKSKGLVKAYFANTHDEVIILRMGTPPSAKSTLLSFLSGKDLSLVLNPLQADISSSGDLGNTYGAYELQAGNTLKEKGYYSHMWKRDKLAKWKIVVSNFRPLRPAKPSE